MALFRFLHVSDLHIADPPEQIGVLDFANTGFDYDLTKQVSKASSHNRGMLRALAELASKEGSRIEGVIITGDLATTGRDKDVKAAYDFVNEPYSPNLYFGASGNSIDYLTTAGEPTLSNSASTEVFIIPGNHDRYKGRRMMPAGRNFDNWFNTKWSVGQSAAQLYLKTKNGVNLALIGGDLSLRKGSHVEKAHFPWQIWGAGRAYRKVIDKMVRLTDKARRQYSPVGIVWLVHFPPEFQGMSSSLRLIKEDRLTQAAANSNVHALLCGHTHEERDYPLSNSSVMVYCAGSATQYRAPYSPGERAVHFLDFTVDTYGQCAITKQTLKWSDAAANWI